MEFHRYTVSDFAAWSFKKSCYKYFIPSLYGQKKYRIHYWSDETDEKFVNTCCNSYTIKGLKSDASYSAYIAVVDGESILPEISNIIEFQTGNFDIVFMWCNNFIIYHSPTIPICLIPLYFVFDWYVVS